MAYTFGARLDDDSYALTTIDEDQGTASTKGEINGVPFESGGGGSSDFSIAEVTLNMTPAEGMSIANMTVETYMNFGVSPINVLDTVMII